MSAVALQVLAEPRRQQLVRQLLAGERSAGELHDAVGEVTFGAVSQHLRKLLEAGVVRRRREGRRRIYSLDRARLGPLVPALEAMWTDRLGALKDAVEAEARAQEEESDG